ncbi:hypothetical protein L0666_04340 [Octadecabacter sp. CECT 8868]|uniref:hypothetical protein n=1 Tax=Octadecabacter algicola TaxID=2909342 RepID=UPI001F2B595C|nr:hypothetical protein [Octadecabacter algicola]MCF2904207.1 hypothetical protein [Octadecabacter algicola]
MRAGLAPTVHNTQPARWVRDGDVLSLFCDTNVGLAVGDPSGRDAALSCGAVLEAMVLALSAHHIAAHVTLTEGDTSHGAGLVAVAHLTLSQGDVDGLHNQLENRFTWRACFADQPVQLFGWTRDDTRLVFDEPARAWLAERNDFASHEIMQAAAFRRELVSWMRLNPQHPRAGLDGMDRASMHMTKTEAFAVPFVLIKFWKILSLLRQTKKLTSESNLTLKSPIIALFHRNEVENPVITGRAYMRLCLEAASLGLAGWPMAALSDCAQTHQETCDRFGIPAGQRLIQAIRFGVPSGPAPTRARRPLHETLL